MIKSARRAFSLIELSIVILIIGIIVAGVVQSSRLVNAFKLTSARTLTQSSPVSGIKDLSVWLESTMESSFDLSDQEDGARVDNWYDNNAQSISKINLTQSTQNLQPLFKSNAINGLPALKFDGDSSNGDYLTSSSFKFDEFTKSDEVTIFLVTKLVTSSNNSPIMIRNSTTSANYRINLHAPETSNLSFDFGACCVSGTGRISVSAPSNFASSQKLISLIKKSSVGIIKVNKSELLNTAMTGSFTSSTMASTAHFDVGRIGYDSSYSFNGYIGEVIIFGRALKSEEISSVEDYLCKKWGISS